MTAATTAPGPLTAERFRAYLVGRTGLILVMAGALRSGLSFEINSRYQSLALDAAAGAGAFKFEQRNVGILNLKTAGADDAAAAFIPDTSNMKVSTWTWGKSSFNHDLILIDGFNFL